MTSRRTRLLTATATAALLGMTASGAMAFEDVHWEWNKLVTEDINIDIDIIATPVPDGLVEVEKLQMHFGNIDAQAHVTDIDNNTVGTSEGSGIVIIDELHDANLEYDNTNVGAETASNPIVGPDQLTGRSGSQLTVELFDEPEGDFGNVNEVGENGNVDFIVRVFGEIPIEELGGVVDALDLPKIENAATAVANNQSITSDVPILLHDAQFAAGDFNDFDDATDTDAIVAAVGLIAGGLAFQEFADDNVHTGLALAMTAAAAGDIIQPATVNANATVSNILNAYVENSATAVTNNASFTIESDTPANHIVVADLTQWGYADVTANAQVWDVDLNGYVNFGAAGMGGGLNPDITPIVSNVATAVGNNLNINVGAPSVE